MEAKGAQLDRRSHHNRTASPFFSPQMASFSTRAHGGPQTSRRAEINFAAKKLLQEQLQSNQAEIPRRPVERDQQIHVARLRCLPPRHRAEEDERLGAEAVGQLRAVLLQNADYVVTRHRCGPLAVLSPF